MNPVWHETFKVGIGSTEKTLEFKVNRKSLQAAAVSHLRSCACVPVTAGLKNSGLFGRILAYPLLHCHVSFFDVCADHG